MQTFKEEILSEKEKKYFGPILYPDILKINCLPLNLLNIKMLGHTETYLYFFLPIKIMHGPIIALVTQWFHCENNF